MALNQRYSHFKHISLITDRDIEPGEAIRIGQVAGVAKTGGAEGERVTIWLDGSYDIEVDGALAEGQAVYIDTDTGELSAEGDTFWGVAATEKSNGTGTAEIAPAGIISPTEQPADTGDGDGN